MTTIIQAVYADGVLRPTKPLALPEGESVDVIVTRINLPKPQVRGPTLPEEDYAQRIKAAKSLNEMYAIMATAPLTSKDDFDIFKEINQTRQLTGFRMPDTDPPEED